MKRNVLAATDHYIQYVKTIKVENKIDTTVRWFYREKDEKIEGKSRFIGGRLSGSTIIYHKTGIPKYCLFFNSKSELIYNAEYDRKGHYISSNGKPISFDFWSRNDSLKIMEPCEFGVFTPKIPFGKVEIHFFNEASDSLTLRSKYEVKEKAPFIKYFFKKRGIKTIPIVVKMTHLPSVVEVDTTWVQVRVIAE